MNYHCARCGDAPDEFGSHGICPTHAEEQWQKYLTNKAERAIEQTEEQEQVAIAA
jgi:hypothetical protein